MKIQKKSLDAATSLYGRAPDIITRFIRHSIVGVSTTILDIILFSVLINIFFIFYLTAVTVSYLLSYTLEYFITRLWGFKGTRAHVIKGYFSFITVGFLGITLTNILMYFFVDSLLLDEILSRIIVGTLIGITTFILNYLFTFKMRNYQHH